jgi:hypothetical protein
MSDYSTHEIVVRVATRVSAYDKEHAVNVASSLLSPVAGVIFVVDNCKLEHSLSDAILEQIKGASYAEGMRDALTYLAELYDGVEDTDLWTDYMSEEESN